MLLMWMSCKKQELFTLRERLDSPRWLGRVHVAHVDVLLETRTVYTSRAPGFTPVAWWSPCCSCWCPIRNKNCLHFASAWIHPGGLVESMLLMWMSYKKQELFTLRERLDSPQGAWWSPCCSCGCPIRNKNCLHFASAWIQLGGLVESMLLMWMPYKKQELFTLGESLD